MKKIAATDYKLGRGLLAAIRRMKDKWTSAKAFAKENDSTAFAEYRRMTRIEKLLVEELGRKRKAELDALQKAVERAKTEPKQEVTDETVIETWEAVREEAEAAKPDLVSYSPTDVSYSSANKEDYSYNSLVQKKDMEISQFTSVVPRDKNGKISREKVRDLALSNVRAQNNDLNTEKFVYAHCEDTNTDVRVGQSGINHGIDRRIETNAKAALIIGDLIRNAIKVNEVYNDTGLSSDDYVLFSAFQDGEDLYGVSILVNRRTNDISGFDCVDILYSENGKKIGTAAPNAGRAHFEKSPRPTVPTISIADLLEKSKGFFTDIFSEDVYSHFGMRKNKTTKMGSTTSYSPASTNSSGRIVIQASQSRPNAREKLTNLKGELSRSNFRAALESLQVIAVNAQQGVENQLVRAGLTKREAAAFSQLARSGRSHAINAICYKLADMTGAIRSEGLIPILEPFLATKGEVYPAADKDGNTVQSTAKGGELAGKRYSDFSDYYAMLHAIDRAAVGKNPYSSMTVAQMKQIVAEYEQKNPDFKAAAEKLSAFNSAMLDIEVQAGIISHETADLWRKQYPHYVPMYTQDSNAVGGKPVRGSRNMEVGEGGGISNSARRFV